MFCYKQQKKHISLELGAVNTPACKTTPHSYSYAYLSIIHCTLRRIIIITLKLFHDVRIKPNKTPVGAHTHTPKTLTRPNRTTNSDSIVYLCVFQTYAKFTNNAHCNLVPWIIIDSLQAWGNPCMSYQQLGSFSCQRSSHGRRKTACGHRRGCV